MSIIINSFMLVKYLLLTEFDDSSRTTYHCARSSEWGDRLPVELEKESKVTMESKGTADHQVSDDATNEEESADLKR